MCTNYEAAVNSDAIYEMLSTHGNNLIHKPEIWIPNKNIRPTNSILTILKKDNNIRLIETNWGIKFNEKSPLIVNSRIETIIDKPFWRHSFRDKRALLPMTGFYEWIQREKRKVRHKIFLPDEEIFFVPAIYYEMKDELFTSLVTVPPNEFMEEIHHRMPAILKPKNAMKLLDVDLETALEMCEPYKGRMKVVESSIR
jgi:putative SOS response-associated peptidase YedK